MAKFIPRNDCLPCIMRFFLFVELVIGALFIIFSLVLQTPPKSAVPMCAIFWLAANMSGTTCACVARIARSGARLMVQQAERCCMQRLHTHSGLTDLTLSGQ